MTDPHEEEIVGKAYDARLMRRLLPYVKPYRGILLFSTIALVFYALLDIAGGLFVKEALDGPVRLAAEGAIGAGEAFSRLLGIVGMYGGVVFFGFLARASHMWVVEYLGQRVMVDLRRDVFAKIQRLSLGFYDRNPVGRLVTRVVSDIEALYAAISSGLVAILGDLIKIVAIVAVLFWLNAGLAAWLLTVIPVLFAVSIYFRNRARRAYREVRREVARTNADLQESITGVRVIQIFAQEEKARARFRRRSDRLLEAHVGTVFHFGWFFPAVEFLFAVAQGILIWFGARYISAESLTVGEFIWIWFLINLVFDPIKDLSNQYNLMQSAMAASERIFRILDTAEDVPNPPAPLPFPREAKGEVVFEDVWFAYQDEKWVLRDLSFRIAPGESVALVGATGAGKTSIISLLSRLYDVNRGRILVDGRDLREYDKYELRSRISVVLQDVFLFAGDILENIRLGHREIDEESVVRAAEAVNADRFIRRLPGEYRAPVLERGSTLSVGQKQLLAFARALAFDPRILVLDEATSSVDTETEILIQRALLQLLEGRTSVIIAHRLSTIKRCDRILVLHHGELREQGTHAELLRRRGIYRRLYELQYRAGNTA